MQTNDFLLINNIIYQIYSISDFNLMKKTFLKLIKMLIPNTAGSILMAEQSNSQNILCDPICFPEEYIEVENNYLKYQKEDAAMWIIISKQCLLIRESDLIPEATRLNSTIYQKCYKPFNLHYNMQLTLVYDNLFLGVVTLYRTKEEGDFTQDDMFILRAFTDHLNLRFYNEYIKNKKTPAIESNIPALADKYNLTNREVEVLQLIFQDISNDDIADKLCISSFTLKKHIQNLYKKLQVSNRWQLLKFRQ